MTENQTLKNFVALEGKLAREPKIIEKNRKPFAVLSIGTRNTYMDDSGTVKYRRIVWHNDCVSFNPEVIEKVRKMQAGDIVSLFGEIRYQKFLTDEGYVKSSATIKITSITTVVND